ncbi:MAG: YfjI family protein, partial [Verrucomicrobia bacterium]|nr:YfjI family protein [Verrucomicrobiota bacterium]
FCASVAEGLQVPPDMVAPLALALASIGTSRALEVELSPQWRETAPLWFAVLAEPGERKSALLSLLSAPLHRWQTDERDHLRHALAAYGERRRTLEAQLVGVRSKLQRPNGTDVDKLPRDALDLAATLENLPALAAPELVTSDATPEALRDLMGRNGEKVALVSAEMDAGQLTGARYGKGGANFDLLLKAFTGDPSPCHRIGKDIPLARPALSLVLCVQPAAVAEVLRDAYAKDKGLVPRLCLIAPASRMGTRANHPAPVPPYLVQWWGDTLRHLLDLKWPARVVLAPDGPTRHEGPPHIMRLTPEASTVFDVLRADLESRIGEGGDLRPVCGYASKLPGVIARIALTLEAMQDPAAAFITADTMRAACEWAPFLLAHFRAVLGDAAEGEDMKLARRLLARVKSNQLAELTARDALRLFGHGTGLTMEELNPALDLLIDYDWLRAPPAAQHGTKGKTSPRYAVNPAALA